MLKLDNIEIQYSGKTVVSKFSLSLKSGEIGCLLGPSGCGKTSVLRAIAGFEPVSAGIIELRGEAVSTRKKIVNPEKRKVAIVFQDFALFPHLTIAENISFGLKGKKTDSINKKVAELLETVGLPTVGSRYPDTLSGGQQQRVALARALAVEPDLLLLDEPFSSLDSEMRALLANDVRDIIKNHNITALMVTHDQDEAFTMSDKVGVVRSGQIEQWDSPYNLYHKPSSKFVAEFIGKGIFIDALCDQKGKIKTALGDFDCLHNGDNASPRFKLLVRPDDIIHDDQSPWRAKVIARAFQGSHILYQLELEEAGVKTALLCLAPSHHDHEIDEVFGIRLEMAHVILFETPSNELM